MATRLDDDRSVGQLLGDATKDLQALARKEFALAKAEAKRLQSAVAAGKSFGVAGDGISGLGDVVPRPPGPSRRSSRPAGHSLPSVWSSPWWRQ